MIKFLPFDFLGVSHSIPQKNKNAVYRLKISALVPEISVFEKCVNFATQLSTKHINRAILANLHHRPLKLYRLIVLQKTHLWL